MKNHIAPSFLLVNGQPSTCECKDLITCAYCVQANLIALTRNYSNYDEETKQALLKIRKNGVRKTARAFGVNPNAVTYWLKTGNIPARIIAKLQGVYNEA